MLVRKCDICDHIIGDETGYVVDIFRTSMPKGVEIRSKTLNTSMEICSECKRAILNALDKRMSDYALTEKEQKVEE